MMSGVADAAGFEDEAPTDAGAGANSWFVRGDRP
jgi:hypothetical protein